LGAWIFRGLLAAVLIFYLWEGEDYSPHAARLPQMVAGVTLLFLLLDAIASWRKERAAADAPPSGDRPFWETPRFFATAGCIIAFFLLFPWLGYIPTSALFVFSLSWLLGERRWHVLAVCSVIAPIAFWYASEAYLKIVMPKGVIFEFFLQ
jgi:hypothetical protein